MRMKKLEGVNVTQESLSEYLTSRYPDRSFDDFSRLLIDLVVELRSGSFATIGHVRKALVRTRKAAECFETENPRSQLVGGQYSAIEIVIISISLLHSRFFISWPNVLGNCSPEKLEEYRKLILPETDQPCVINEGETRNERRTGSKFPTTKRM
jgi:hypothetical protein